VSFATVIGLIAAALTTTSAIPQVVKCWRTGSSGDLSLLAVSLQASGQCLWILYGALHADAVIVVANVVSAGLTLNLVWFKVTAWRRARAAESAQRPSTVRPV
jgi:MtN3 and saliva related transmembrane protein